VVVEGPASAAAAAALGEFDGIGAPDVPAAADESAR
jgi:hypothetical protein